MSEPAALQSIRTDTPKGRSMAAIARAAQATGVDFSYLYHQARLESGLNPDAKARTSSATGLYQFINQSWLGVVDRHGAEHGLGWAADAIERRPDGRFIVRDPQMRTAIMELRKNPDAAAIMAGEFAADNRAYLEQHTGQNVAPVDLYLAHFLGPAGAAKFLNARSTAPDQSAAALFPEAARTNRNIFYGKDGAPRSLEAVRALFARKMGDGATAPMAMPPAGPSIIPVGSADPAPENHVLPDDYARIAADLERRNGLNPSATHAQPIFGAGEARLAYLMLASFGLSTNGGAA